MHITSLMIGFGSLVLLLVYQVITLYKKANNYIDKHEKNYRR